MANYRISKEAEEDLRRIYRRGSMEFGEVQADLYFNAMFDRFDDLAERPQMYQAVDHIRAGYRRSVCGVDSIYYRIVNETVEIMRVLGHQDLHQL